ncbi:MAG: carboxypeptidase regulatory-like domain-containing protein [Acidobacteria bacterium]|nr:carboxypeptidase regulatory-like domain-containing protein [Acidobacteriota bacterium]
MIQRLLFAVALWIEPVWGQSLFGVILGTVTDVTQARVANARITVRSVGTNASRSVTTSPAGDYEIPALPVGVYDLTAEAPGFKVFRFTGAVLQVDQRLRLDLTLLVGELSQTIEVAASARLIETENATQGTVIDNRRIVELPLNGRNFQQLASLGPGVVAPVPGSGDRISIAGARNLSVSFLMDGTTNSNTNANTAMISPSIDLIQEFKVLRNTFNAEFGHGAAQINLVTKSGGNQLHLTLFEFLRNDKLQARDFFDLNKPVLRRNQFGGTGSGPVFLPWLYDGRNRSFWLINYEGVRQRTPNTIRASFPTQAEMDGNLTTLAGALNDPFTSQPFPGRLIPASRINSSSRAYRQFMPATTVARGFFGQNFNVLKAGSGASDSDQLTLRFDHNFSNRSNGFARPGRSFRRRTSSVAAKAVTSPTARRASSKPRKAHWSRSSAGAKDRSAISVISMPCPCGALITAGLGPGRKSLPTAARTE